MDCPNCGRPMVGRNRRDVRCTNVKCPGIRWTGIGKGGNLVELTPLIERQPVEREFVGKIYVREIRVVDGHPCQGVSLSTVVCGEDPREVRSVTFTTAKSRADVYEARGYEVRLNKLRAA